MNPSTLTPFTSFIKNLFVGPFHEPYRFVRPALQNQWKNITTIWNNEADATFGLERLLRLILAISGYLFPGIYIRHISGKRGLLPRKLALDAYVLLKLIFPIVILLSGAYQETWAQIIVAYLGMETLFYVAGLLFLSDIYKDPISYKRSYLMFMMNYAEICFDFAVLYGGLRLVNGVTGGIDAAYFSFVTGMTIGYGDILPNSPYGKVLIMLHSLCSLFFISLALAKAVGSFDVNHAKKPTESKKKS